MDNKNEFLNEEKYQKNEKLITLIAIIILIIGLSGGGFLIYNGIVKPSTNKVDELKIELENKKRSLEEKGINYNNFAKYTDGEEYDLKIITNALDPSFSYCSFDEYKNNSLTKDYCVYKNSIGSFASTSSIMFGAFICIVTCMISGFVFMIAKRRKMLAFSIQQSMPIAQEGLEKITPSVANAAGTIAESVSKGIKNGLENTKEK